MGQNIMATNETWKGFGGFNKDVATLVNFIKEKCDIRKERQFCIDTVLCRTSQILHYKSSSKQCEEACRRRARITKWGRLSESSEPYQSAGNVVLDIRKLVLGSLVQGMNMPMKELGDLFKTQSKEPSQKQHEASNVGEYQAEKETRDVSLPVLPSTRTAGLRVVLEAVARAEKLVIAVHGRQYFQEAVGKLRGERRAGSPRWGSTSRKTPHYLVENFQKQQEELEVKERKIKLFREKLLATYYILTSLTNIKPRDLKSKSPLSHKYVYMLRRNGLVNSGTKQQTRNNSSETMCSVTTPSTMSPRTPCPQTTARERHQSPQSVSAKSRGKEDIHFRDNRTPLWQTAISADIPAIAQIAGTTKTNNPVDVLLTMRNRFVTLQQSLENYYRHKTEKLDREQLRRFRQKFLASSPNVSLEKTLETMRAAARVQERETHADVKPALWFQNLQTESKLLGADDRFETQSVFAKLQRFHLEDGCSIPNVKEKLCLLVLSIPVAEICTPHWQAAIELILKDMLFVPQAILRQWLFHRKLPYMI